VFCQLLSFYHFYVINIILALPVIFRNRLAKRVASHGPLRYDIGRHICTLILLVCISNNLPFRLSSTGGVWISAWTLCRVYIRPPSRTTESIRRRLRAGVFQTNTIHCRIALESEPHITIITIFVFFGMCTIYRIRIDPDLVSQLSDNLIQSG